MKSLKNFVQHAFLLLALLAGTTAFAQQGRGQQLSPQERTQRQLERYQKQLDLTADQTSKIKEIVTASMEEMQKLRGQAGSDRQAMFQSMQALNQKRNEQIKAVLTEEQKAKFEKMQAEMQDRRGGDGPGRGQRNNR